MTELVDEQGFEVEHQVEINMRHFLFFFFYYSSMESVWLYFLSVLARDFIKSYLKSIKRKISRYFQIYIEGVGA